MVPIVAGLLMGAALGGGIAALQKKDVLQGALMGGIGGALGGAFMPAAGAAGAVPTTEAAAGALVGRSSDHWCRAQRHRCWDKKSLQDEGSPALLFPAIPR